MPWVAPLVMAAGSIGSALIAKGAAADDRAAALNANKEAIQKWMDIHIPDPDEQKIALQRFVQTGTLTPAVEQAVKQDPSAFEQVQIDPRLKEAQLGALSQLQDIGSSGGMQLEDKANLQHAMSDIASADKGRRDALAAQYASRGLGGSGLELASQLQGIQAANNQTSQAQLDTAASARQRALQAIMQGGQLAGSIRGQDYSQQADLARARDAISQFNARNLQDVTRRNTDRSNTAQQYNLGLQQNVANLNTGLANQEEMYNKGLIQQQFENRAKQAAGASGQYGNLANQYNANADRTAGMWAGIGSGIGQAAGQIGQYYNNQQGYGGGMPGGESSGWSNAFALSPTSNQQGSLYELDPDKLKYPGSDY